MFKFDFNFIVLVNVHFNYFTQVVRKSLVRQFDFFAFSPHQRHQRVGIFRPINKFFVFGISLFHA
uniref:Lef-4 protein n=1 Tax=Autographa californica nuclear polyhedrosis virus TaxID=46015 RepID=Q65345_NPVAC|nr:7.8kDa protein; putative [Autographa californica nucleopolyhedrovirus]